jgi:integrase
MTTRSGFGTVRKLPSGRWQASYVWPKSSGQRHCAPTTFDAKRYADGWLRARWTDIQREQWTEPVAPRGAVPTFASFAADWMATRPLRGRSAREYRSVLGGHLLPAFGALRLDQITPRAVAEWHGSYGQRTPSTRAKAYRVMHAIMTTAVEYEIIAANPCRVRRGGSDSRTRRITIATEHEIDVIADAIRPEWRLMVLLAAWCSLRFGELAELRRRDVDLDGGVLRIDRAVTRGDHGLVSGPPKSAAGIRSVHIPADLVADLAQHLLAYAQPGERGLLFTTHRGGQLYESCMYRDWNRARIAAGRPDLRFHDLRHTGLTMAAEVGATTKQLMRRAGHANPAMAMIYQHATDRADAELAGRLGERRSAAVADLRAARERRGGTA